MLIEKIYNFAKESKLIRINQSNIDTVCFYTPIQEFDEATWSSPFSSIYTTEHKIDFWFVFNTINFCFWQQPKWSVHYKGEIYQGSHALRVCIERALAEGIPILDAPFLAHISESALAYILRGENQIPLFRERVTLLQEVGFSLLSKGSQKFSSLIPLHLKVDQLIDVIVTLFPSFNDSVSINGEQLSFYKRAQLLVSQILMETKQPNMREELEKLTVFADYRLPQALRGMGILEYSSVLEDKIDSEKLITSGSQEEIEIRVNTIISSHLMLEKLKSRKKDITPVHLDAWLWKQAKSNENKIPPHHRTITIFY